jgi:hypothetical protein
MPTLWPAASCGNEPTDTCARVGTSAAPIAAIATTRAYLRTFIIETTLFSAEGDFVHALLHRLDILG